MQNRTDGGSRADGDRRRALLGTLGYMSPEQVQGQPTDYRTDCFSFGCVLYEAITGKRAFLGAQRLRHAEADRRARSGAAGDARAVVPDGLERIVRNCLAKDPTQRYGSMREVAADLREVRRKMNDTAVVEVPRRAESPIVPDGRGASCWLRQRSQRCG
jgi:serine/threonine protein kinase